MIRPLSQLGLREFYQGGHEVAHPVSTVSAGRDQADVVGRVRVLNNRNPIRIVKKLISGNEKNQLDQTSNDPKKGEGEGRKMQGKYEK
jgi:hypothetical protein